MFLFLIIWPLCFFGQPFKYQLLPLSFAPGSAELAASDSPVLDSLAAFLQKTGAKVEIGGHTDNLGTPAQNAELSRFRAQAVSDYLQTKHKIPSDRLSVKGYGPAQPIATNRTPAGRARNNRIEITIMPGIPGVTIRPLRGMTRVRKPGLTDWSEVLAEQRVSVSDAFETDSAGYAVLVFENGGSIRLRPRTVLVIEELTPQAARLWSEGGSFRIDNHSTAELRTKLTVTTAISRLICRSGDGFMVVRPNYQDAVSVWRGSMTVQDRAEGPVVEAAAGSGIRGRIGSAPEPAVSLPQAPVILSVSGQDTLWFEPEKPVKFVLHFSKPDNVSARIMLSRDKDQQDIIAELDTENDSLFCSLDAVDAVFVSVSSVDAEGLVSPRTAVRLVGLARKTTGPRLDIIRQSVDVQDGKKVLRIEGRTDPLSSLTVNQENVRIPADGSFSMMVRLKSGTNRVILTATNRWGHATSRYISLAAGRPRQVQVFTGPAYLSGSGYNTSRIGLLYGLSLTAIPLSDRLGLGAFGAAGAIGCRTTDWEPDGDHYKTTFTLGGLGLAYQLNPAAPAVFRAGIEAGLIYWKSFYDDDLMEWAFSPYACLTAGCSIPLAGRLAGTATAAAGYVRNKDKPNLGAEGVKYLLPHGRLGLAFGF